MNKKDDEVIQKYLLNCFREIRKSDHSKGNHMLDDEFIVSLNNVNELTVSVVCYVEEALNGKIINLFQEKLPVSDDFKYNDVKKFFNKNNIIEHDNYNIEVIALYYNEVVRWVSQHE